MDEWHDFFLAQAGAAGVLTGLVFVAASINLQQIVSEPGSGLPGRAAEALILLVGVLTASVLLRVALGQIATLPLVVAGFAVLVGGLGGLYWLVAGMVFSTLVALFEAWVLLVEINRSEKSDPSHHLMHPSAW